MAREKIAIWAFIKFGSKENIDRLLNLGEIFINSTCYTSRYSKKIAMVVFLSFMWF